MSPMPKFLAQFEPDQLNWLRREARHLHLSASDLLRRIVHARMPATVDKNAVPPIDPKKPIYEKIYRGKGNYDECTTVLEMLTRHTAVEQYLHSLIKDGVHLEQSIDGDYAFLITNDPKVAKKHCMHKRETEE